MKKYLCPAHYMQIIDMTYKMSIKQPNAICACVYSYKNHKWDQYLHEPLIYVCLCDHIYSNNNYNWIIDNVHFINSVNEYKCFSSK